MTIETGFHLRNYKSFGSAGIELKNIKSINVIVGRNNIGKSALLHALDFLCKDRDDHSDIASSIEITQPLDEKTLMQVFQVRASRGDLGGNHWDDHGIKFVDALLTWKEITDRRHEFVKTNAVASEIELKYISKIHPTLTLRSFKHIKLDADRDITPESIDGGISLSSSGVGATQIIHKYLQHVEFDRSLIQNTLLTALNKIFFPDIIFNEIVTRFHSTQNKWEIFIGEHDKGPIALSASGSGLKTIILTLLNLLIRPDFEKTSVENYIFSLEELENNLHPALQRNLFIYLEEFALIHHCHIFLTTHSNVAIDIFGSSQHSQILHVIRGEDGVIGKAYTGDAVGHGVLDDLGVRASDLLQANGLIWVEGPSDRVFLKKWIELWSNNELNEGRHYQFVFYGGSVLANIDARLPDNESKEAITAFRINRNFAFICDSDRKNSNGSLKPRVAQLIKEVADTRSMIWITRCKEIENYIPKEVFEIAHTKNDLPHIGEYEAIQEYLRKNKISNAKEYTDKHSKAFAYAAHMTKENLSFRPELQNQITNLIKKIRNWNS
ncbi:ATP-dependent nuclease [Pseudomonas yamanorum]|uniref:ATP-binding protein n=1 Tax=Pseudomonas yamanorum TaxID=515393 RepID=A0AAJ3HB46_9PSED|nr:AAA family ATPase [Pseudomonas yamanorum]NWD45367.1 ATP-binding protein [Pseudomonas yamanorum]